MNRSSARPSRTSRWIARTAGRCCSVARTPSCGSGTNTCSPWNCWTKRRGPRPSHERPAVSRVGDLMRPAVTSVERDAHLAAATYLFKKAGDSALVVINDPTERVPLRVITDGEVAQAVADGRDPNAVRISDLVSREPMTLSPDTGVAAAAELMLSSGAMYMPVVGGTRLLGIVDISDVCRGLLTTRGDSDG